MPKMKIYKKVFPFICSNSKCKTKYNIEKFADVVMLWGFIYLTNKKNNLIGITCPECRHTTVNKYTTSTPDFSIDMLQKQKQSTTTVSFDDIPFGVIPTIKQFVPFSINILEHFSLIENEDIKQDAEQELFEVAYIYEVPSGFEPVAPYSSLMQKEFKFGILERSLHSICDIENKKKLKALPRIVNFNSVYKNIDTLLLFVSNQGGFSLDEIDDLLAPLISPSDKSSNDIPDTYKDMVKNNLSPEDYKDLDFALIKGRKKDFLKELINLLKELSSIRNQIDFEIIFRNKVLNRYARILYDTPGLYSKMPVENYDIVDFLVPIDYYEQPEQNLVSYPPLRYELSETTKNTESNQTNDVIITGDKKKCQAKAEELWGKARKNGDYILSSEQMAKKLIYDKFEVAYSKETLYSWVSEVTPLEAKKQKMTPKKKCQAKAFELWDKAITNGDVILSSGEMAKHPEILEIENKFRPATRQRWVSKVAPFEAKQAGVRPKKKQ
jgi:hypothetical protein